MNRLPPDLAKALHGKDLIVFDGECVLCSRFFRFMLRYDKSSRFSYAIAQSTLGTQLYQALDLRIDDFETNLVIVNGQIYQRLDAFTAAMRALGGIWHLPALLRFLPSPLKNFAYHRIARNRYAIFGRYDTCMVPTPALQARFLDGGI